MYEQTVHSYVLCKKGSRNISLLIQERKVDCAAEGVP